MKALRLCTLALFTSWLLGSPAWARPWVIVVGIDDYLNPSIPDLRYACSDAKLLAQAAEQLLQVPKEQIFRFTSDSLLEQELPRVTNIVYRLDWLRTHCKPEDTILFYFAGHGITGDGDSYLLTEESDNRSAATLKSSALNARDLSRMLRTSPARQTLMLLDACRNDPHQPGARAEPLALGFSDAFSLSLPEQESATLFSCSVGERSWEWEEQKHGFFTYYLVEGLRHGASLPNGQVTLGSLFDFVSEKVPDQTLRVTQARQRPILRYEGPSANRWNLSRVKLPPGLKSGPQGVAQIDAGATGRDRAVVEQIALQSRLEAEENRRKQLEIQIEALEKQMASKGASELVAELTLSRDQAVQELRETRKKLESVLSQADSSGVRSAEAALIAAEREQLQAENKVLMARIAVLEARAQQKPMSLAREVFLLETDSVTQGRLRDLGQRSELSEKESIELAQLSLEREIQLSQLQIRRASAGLSGALAPRLDSDQQQQVAALLALEKAADFRLTMAENRARSLNIQQRMQEMLASIASPQDRLRYQRVLVDLEQVQAETEQAFLRLRHDYQDLRQEMVALTRDPRFRSRVISRRYYQINRLPGLGDILDVPIRVEEAQSYPKERSTQDRTPLNGD